MKFSPTNKNVRVTTSLVTQVLTQVTAQAVAADIPIRDLTTLIWATFSAVSLAVDFRAEAEQTPTRLKRDETSTSTLPFRLWKRLTALKKKFLIRRWTDVLRVVEAVRRQAVLRKLALNVTAQAR